ncbi:MAG: hypothetical protein LUO93_07930 [Methanomicrobiales archaeon]|nr:hypothetical protein [Methanomicrobiales archaeon]
MRLRPDPRYGDLVVRGMLVVLLVVSFGLLGDVIVVHGAMSATYTGISNAIQLVASAATVGAAAWVYFHRNPSLFVAHGTFAGATWTLANGFWYAYLMVIGEGLNYPTVADLGFAGAFFFLTAGILEGQARGHLSGWVAVSVAVPLLVFGFWPVILSGVNAKTITTLIMFVLATVLLSEALLRSVYRHPPLFAAIVAFVLAHLFNSLTSTLVNPPWVTHAAGALAAIAFSLFALGFYGYTTEGRA